jgi:heme iron utilization protein
MSMNSGPTTTPIPDARALLRAARAGTLATNGDGQPFASLVTPATTPDGAVLLLLSGLSEHTRHLRTEPRCAVMVAGPQTEANPQTAPRLTVTGLAAPEPDPVLKARWVALHPYAAFYAGFGDFQLWRITPKAGLYIGGFASATRLRQADLAWDPAAVQAVAEAEAGVLSHCNDDHAEALDLIAAMSGKGEPGWRMVACDVDGCDLARDEIVLRVPWSTPVANSGGIRTELVRLTNAARSWRKTALDDTSRLA